MPDDSFDVAAIMKSIVILNSAGQGLRPSQILHPSQFKQLKELVDAAELYSGIVEVEKEANELSQHENRSSVAARRKKLRDKMIPAWCLKNLKKGMIVKVTAASNTKYRRIKSVDKDSFYGQHLYERKRAGKLTDWTDGGYITDHYFNKIQQVQVLNDDTGQMEMVPIMDLIEK